MNTNIIEILDNTTSLVISLHKNKVYRCNYGFNAQNELCEINDANIKKLFGILKKYSHITNLELHHVEPNNILCLANALKYNKTIVTLRMYAIEQHHTNEFKYLTEILKTDK